jgi:hypothetical protein
MEIDEEEDSSEDDDEDEDEEPGKTPTKKHASGKQEDLSELANSMAALKFIPPSVRFGRGRGKAGFSKQ